MKRRLVVGMLTAVLTLALCGCSGSVGDKQAKQKIDAAIDKLDGIKSVENTISSNMDVELLGEKMDVEITGEYVRFYQPVKMKMSMQTNYEGLENSSYQFYMEEEDGILTVYQDQGDGWEKQVSEIEESSAAQGYDLKEELENTYSSLRDYEELGTETIDGRECIKIRARMSLEDSLNAMTSMGSAETMALQNGLDLDIDQLTEGVEPLEIYTWIDSEQGYIVQYRLDMTQATKTIYINLLEQMGMPTGEDVLKVHEVSMDMKFENYDRAADFSIPDEARNAPKGKIFD